MIKSDSWLRAMCNHDSDGNQFESKSLPMIEPFHPGLVSKADGEKIISFGTSSYGYDARCSREFKLFTNINSAIVDPKNFDDNSFVDIEADSIIIPPNSFALARTEEYFRIPRDVLVVCLGKSTYARCFTGDTKVALVDGTSISLKRMAKLARRGERFFGYTILNDGTVGVAELLAPRKTGKQQKLVEVVIDSGEVIRCTPDHLFMTRDGDYVEAQDLDSGVSLMPLYRYEARGYEGTYCPGNGHIRSTHWLTDEYLVREGELPERKEGEHTHHIDGDRRNNHPFNLERVAGDEHIREHNYERAEDDPEYATRFAERMSDWRRSNPESWKAHQSNRAKRFWYGEEHEETRTNLLRNRRKFWRRPENRKAASERMLEAWAKSPESFPRNHGSDHHNYKKLSRKKVEQVILETGSVSTAARAFDVSKNLLYRRFPNMMRRLRNEGAIRQRSGSESPIARNDLTDLRAYKALEKGGSVGRAAELLGCSISTLKRRFRHVIDEAQRDGLIRNHKVVEVVHLDYKEDVYCLTVPGTHNFALEAGVFVHNCGLVINVTPLEPEWEGHVTLEISNTTPLPARVYANEGIAQFLFLGADEVCKTSYKDRNGKYQGQTGVVPPRT